MEEKVLILGGSGLIGSNINFGIKVTSKDVNLLDYKETYNFIKKINPEVVINAAAKKVSSKLLYDQPAVYFDENVQISLNVFKACANLKIKRLLVFASINAFFKNNDTLLADSYNHTIKQILSDIYWQQYKLNSKVIFLGNIYGPMTQICNGVIPTIINKCHDAKINNTDLVLEGNEKIKREFTYVDDIISLSKQFIYNSDPTNYNSNEPLIISSGVSHSLGDIVSIVANHMNFNNSIIWRGDSDNIKDKKFKSNSVKKLSTKFKFTSLETGIIKTIEWFNNKNIK